MGAGASRREFGAMRCKVRGWVRMENCVAPKVAVLTVNLNMSEGLAKTIESVRRQTFRDFEFGVVDGASSDDSLSVIEKNADIINWHVSEQDRGIYDAMNKAVCLSHAEWIVFLNSGDSFFNSDVLERIFKEGAFSADLVYGDASVIYPDGHKRLWKGEPPARLPYGMVCSHQALFVRRSLLQETPFSLGKTASDYEFILIAWLRGKRFHRMPIVISEFSAGGISDRKRVRSIRQRWGVIRQAGLATNGLRIYYAGQILRTVAVTAVKSWLPPRVKRWLRVKFGY